MDPEIREGFDEIRSLLHAGVEWGNQMELRFNRRMDRAEQRAAHADERMDKFDRQLQATRKLVQQGRKIVVRMGEHQRVMVARQALTAQVAELTVLVRDLTKTQRAFMLSLCKSGNRSKRIA